MKANGRLSSRMEIINMSKREMPAADQVSNLTQIAYDKISSAIVYGRLDLGEPLSEAELAKALNVSKSPIRNAINELKARGLVEIIPQSGTYVFTPTREKIVELSEFRFILEENALRASMERDRAAMLDNMQGIIRDMQAAWAASNAMEVKKCDTEFHWCFIRHSGNSYLTAAYSDISPLVEALRYRFMDTVSYRNKAFEEHQRIVELLLDDRIDKVVRVLRDHVERTKEFQSNMQWTGGRSQRKFYRARDYSKILFDGA
jgi:DNA-binding GntR family transcriptional regulator